MSLIFTEAALAPLITCIFSVSLGTYIYVIDHEHPSNKIFIIFMNAMALLTFLDFLQAISNNEDLAGIFSKLKYAYLLVIPTLFLHLSISLTDNKNILHMGKYLFIPYLICSLFFILTLSTDFIVTGVVFENNTYGTDAGPLLNVLLVCTLIFLIAGLIFLIVTFKSTKSNDKKIQLRYIFYGMSITAIIFMGVDQILPAIINIVIEGTIIFTLPMFIFYAYAILKFKLMSKVQLVTEEIPSKPIDYEIEPGYTYIIPEKEPKIGFQLFAKTVKEGAHGICIMMRDPVIVREKYGLRKTPIIWITKKETNEISVRPENIDSINEILKPFFEKSQDSVIFLIDDKAITAGIKVPDHSKILELSKNFFDSVVNLNSRFIISVNPKSIAKPKKTSIIKTKRPILEFTRLTTFIFEEICNNILQFLIRNAYLKPDEITSRITNLSQRDPFFKNIKYHNTTNSRTDTNKIRFTNVIESERLSKQLLIDKIKIFMTEFENIETAINLNTMVLDSVTKYGLSKNEFQLHSGDTYIVPEPDVNKSFEIFTEFISKEFKGLLITKSNPEKLKRKYALDTKDVVIYWLTDISKSKQKILPPKLEHILSAIEDFLEDEQSRKIVLLDGIEYLIFYSGDIFDAVLGFLRRLADKVSETNALVLIPLDPKAISEQRLSLLTRSGIEIYELE